MLTSALAGRCCFILVKPKNPDNVGAAARAIKTMGFTRLRLVTPCDHLGPGARALAHDSAEILESAEIFGTLEAALHDIDFSVATTARRRHVQALNILDIGKGLAQFLERLPALRSGALVFGNEEHGLTNGELESCDCIARIPLAAPQPSLNLAQAVMVTAFSLASGSDRSGASRAVADPRQDRALRQKLERVCDRIGIRADSLFLRKAPKRLALLTARDQRMILFFLGRLEARLDKKLI